MPLFAPAAAMRLRGPGPYAPWMLARDPATSPWGVRGPSGVNVLEGPGGAVMVGSRAEAEAVIARVEGKNIHG